jgi:hypothetical protein
MRVLSSCSVSGWAYVLRKVRLASAVGTVSDASLNLFGLLTYVVFCNDRR